MVGFVKSFAFTTVQSGALKIFWDDYCLGVFGVQRGSVCVYRAYIDNTHWGGDLASR